MEIYNKIIKKETNIYNINKINEVEKTIDKLHEIIKMETKNFSKEYTRNERISKFLSNLSTITLSTSILLLSIVLMFMMMEVLQIPLLITSIIFITSGLWLSKESILLKKENKINKNEFNIEIKKEYEKIKSCEEVLELRNILKKYYQTNFIDKLSIEEIKQKIKNREVMKSFSEEEILTLSCIIKDLDSVQNQMEKLKEKSKIKEKEMVVITNSLSKFVSEFEKEEKGFQKVKK